MEIHMEYSGKPEDIEKLQSAITEVKRKMRERGVSATGEMNAGRIKYEYLTEADIVQAVVPALNEHSVGYFLSCVGCKLIEFGKMIHAVAEYDYTIYGHNARISGKWHAQAADTGDKALTKAHTMAVKTFLRVLAGISSGDEEDGDSYRPEIDGNQVGATREKRKKSGIEKIRDALSIGLDNVVLITAHKYYDIHANFKDEEIRAAVEILKKTGRLNENERRAHIAAVEIDRNFGAVTDISFMTALSTFFERISHYNPTVELGQYKDVLAENYGVDVGELTGLAINYSDIFATILAARFGYDIATVTHELFTEEVDHFNSKFGDWDEAISGFQYSDVLSAINRGEAQSPEPETEDESDREEEEVRPVTIDDISDEAYFAAIKESKPLMPTQAMWKRYLKQHDKEPEHETVEDWVVELAFKNTTEIMSDFPDDVVAGLLSRGITALWWHRSKEFLSAIDDWLRQHELPEIDEIIQAFNDFQDEYYAEDKRVILPPARKLQATPVNINFMAAMAVCYEANYAQETAKNKAATLAGGPAAEHPQGVSLNLSRLLVAVEEICSVARPE